MYKKLVFLVLIGILPGLSPIQAQTASGSTEDSVFASALWQAVVSARLAGPEAMQSKPFLGHRPHGAVLQTFYTTLTVNDETGEVIVKRSYSGEGVSELAVANNSGKKFLTAIAVMFKRPEYDSDNADWFWAEYSGDGSLSDSQNCIDCHSTAAGGDFVFTR